MFFVFLRQQRRLTGLWDGSAAPRQAVTGGPPGRPSGKADRRDLSPPATCQPGRFFRGRIAFSSQSGKFGTVLFGRERQVDGVFVRSETRRDGKSCIAADRYVLSLRDGRLLSARRCRSAGRSVPREPSCGSTQGTTQHHRWRASSFAGRKGLS